MFGVFLSFFKLKWFLQMWSRILCPALTSIYGMCSSSRNGSKGDGITLRRVALLWWMAHLTITSHALSGQTLSPRRHWNLDFNIPNVFSISPWVLQCARLNVVCGPGAGLGYGVMSIGRHGYPRSPRRYPSNCPAIKYKLWAILHKHNNYEVCGMFIMQRTLLKCIAHIGFTIYPGIVDRTRQFCLYIGDHVRIQASHIT